MFTALGLVSIILGSELVVESATQIATTLGVYERVISLTIIAIGTSLPELVTTIISSIKKEQDILLGNIIGSNIFNGLAILGASALMMPIVVDRSVLFRDLPYMLIVTLMLFLLVFFDGHITRLDAALFIALFIIYLSYTYHVAMSNRKSEEKQKTMEEKTSSYAKLVLQIVVGMTALVIGARLMVSQGAEMARILGVSESMIGLTILAGGTSLPELATSMMAAHKGREGLAVGNVIGSNVFNIAGILGACAIIHPMQVEEIAITDWITLVGSGILIWILSFTRNKIEKYEGALLLLCFFTYMFHLICK